MMTIILAQMRTKIQQEILDNIEAGKTGRLREEGRVETVLITMMLLMRIKRLISHLVLDYSVPEHNRNKESEDQH